ncbi:receptor-like protein 56 [Lactuca sativa]|nr:receptor-like protein 56 [Lactuca sativa]
MCGNYYYSYIFISSYIKCFPSKAKQTKPNRKFNVVSVSTKPPLAAKMECWACSKHKSLLCWLLMLMMIHILIMAGHTQGDCVEEERKALLEIKTSYMKSYGSEIDNFLPTWVDYGGGTPGDGGSNCCDWERINCSTTTVHVTDLSLYNLRGVIGFDAYWYKDESKLWPLNVSLFLHFKELTSLNLSQNSLDKEFMKSGLERLSSLKKLEVLDLSGNRDIDNDILPSLKTLTSLKVLDLSDTSLNGNFPTNEFGALENLEVLDLSYCRFNGTFEVQGSERVSILRKLKSLNLAGNWFNESVITSLKALSSLTNLDLSYNQMPGPFPAQELSHLTNLEELDLSSTHLNGTPNIQDCKTLSRLKRLKSINLSYNNFNKSIISCLTALPSLKILDLTSSFSWGSSFPVQEFLNLSDLEVLLLSSNGFNGTIPIEAFASFHHLEVLDLSWNSFVGSVPSAIQALSSLRALSFARNKLNGSLPDHGLCELKNLHELDLSGNMLHGTLPQCLKNLSSLKLLDISSNQFSGILKPSLIANLTSLEYIDFSHNKFEGSFSFSSLSNHIKLEVVRFGGDNDKSEVETEEPIGWIPMFQLKILELSNCNMKMPKGHVIPGFLVHQHKLRQLDMSQNSLEGHFPNWLVKNNTYLEGLVLRNNLFVGMPLYRNANMLELDMSGNGMIGIIPDDIPKFFPNMGHLNLSMNSLSGVIPSSVGELSELVMLDLSDNELSGEIPKGLFTNISKLNLLKLSNNKLHGEVLSGSLSWGWLQFQVIMIGFSFSSYFNNGRILRWSFSSNFDFNAFETDDEVEFTTKRLFLSYKGDILDYMAGLDFSCNKLTGEIPQQLGFLTQLRALNLSHNQLTGPIPVSFSNLTKIESLDLSSNGLTGNVPSELIKLTSLSTFIVSHNNLSGRLPEFTAQFGTFSEASYEGNPLLCGPPLVKKCTTTNSQLTNPSDEEEDNEKWYDIDMTCFYGSSSSTCFVFLSGFVAILYTNPWWRRRWLDWVEDCMFTFYYSLSDLARKPSLTIHKQDLH